MWLHAQHLGDDIQHVDLDSVPSALDVHHGRSGKIDRLRQVLLAQPGLPLAPGRGDTSPDLAIDSGRRIVWSHRVDV